jgi:hypothetical protein
MPYLSAYPRPGQVALLCEGDVIGYEATLFQKWTGAELGNDPLVDIWCCGTSSSMLGISDAIGRSRPIFAIEDRDFRTMDEVRDDCARYRKDRENRAVKIISWSAWNRSEIENYLLEPGVLLPVFRTAFGCSDHFKRASMQWLARGVNGCQLIRHPHYCRDCVQGRSGKTKLLFCRIRSCFEPDWKRIVTHGENRYRQSNARP